MNIKLITAISFIYFLSAIGAIAIFGIPMQWISTILIIILPFLTKNYVFSKDLNLTLYLVILISSIFITFLSLIFIDFSWPVDATTSFYFYFLLRIFNFLGFFIIANYIYSLSKKDNFIDIIQYIQIIGIIICLTSIYIYFAQIFGFPDIPRSRIGTSGGEQSINFTAFRRAMGTFREPSHLAEWLVLPLFCSLYLNNNKFYKYIFFLTILLTGSLTAIISIFISIIIVYLIIYIIKFNIFNLYNLFSIFFKLIYLLIILLSLDYLFGGNLLGIITTIYSKIDLLINSGLVKSNRSYIYDFISENKPPIFGYGYGIPNSILSNFLKSNNLVSFLSLYYLHLYSFGYIGLILLIIFLLLPVIKFYNYITISEIKNKNNSVLLLISYVTWLIMFFVHSEEFSLSFGINYALIIFITNKYKFTF